MNSKNYEIEALRGLAVIAVIVSHIGNLAYWIPGLGDRVSRFGLGAGVDLFFVISGYVITKAFGEQLRTSGEQGFSAFRLACRSFIVRRAFRVMPAAMAWILIVCACSLWFNTTGIFGELQDNFADLISILFNYSNVHFAMCIMDGSPPGRCGYNVIYWSVSLEEQFYIVFPLLMLVRKRWIGALTCLVVFVLMLTFRERTLLVWFTRVDGLLAGVCLAFASSTAQCKRVGGWIPTGRAARFLIVSILSTAILAMPLLRGRLHSLYPEMTTLWCLLLVAVTSFKRDLAFSPGPWRSVLAYIGSRSFALYLVHNPAAWITRESGARLGDLATNGTPMHPAVFTLATFAIVLVLAEVTYRVIETPWRNWGRQISMDAATVARGRIAQVSFAPSAAPPSALVPRPIDRAANALSD